MTDTYTLIAAVDIVAKLAEFADSFWAFLADMAPYLLFGFLVAGVLSVFLSAEQVQRHLGGHGFWPVLKASLFGIPLPLCSCSVLPVAASLRKHGAGRGATTAFLIGVPQTGVDNILVTLSLLGPVWAIFTPIATFVSSLLGGTAVDILEPHGDDDKDVIEKCTDSCCNGERRRGVHHRFANVLRHAFIELPRDLAKPLLIGVVIAGAIGVIFPPDAGLLKPVGSGLLGIFVMMLIGIPMYVCATASIPVAAALVAGGASPGAALAFLIAGPATNAAAIATIWKLLGRRTALIYLATIAVTAVGSGLLLNLIISELQIKSLEPTHEMLPLWVKTASAFILLAVLLFALLRRKPCGDVCCASDGHDHEGHKHDGHKKHTSHAHTHDADSCCDSEHEHDDCCSDDHKHTDDCCSHDHPDDCCNNDHDHKHAH